MRNSAMQMHAMRNQGCQLAKLDRKNKHAQRQVPKQTLRSRRYEIRQYSWRQCARWKNVQRKDLMSDVTTTKDGHILGQWDDNSNDKLGQGLIKFTETPQKYVGDAVGCHIGRVSSVKYVARWYSYTSADDTVHLPNIIPQHFIAFHWRWAEGKGMWWRLIRRNDKSKRPKSRESSNEFYDGVHHWV